MKMQEGNEKEKRRAETTLGWLAQSSIMPKKRKEIQGVSDASIIGLKAQLVKRQHEARSDAVAFKKSRTAFKSLEENRSNPGVAERDRRDRLALKALKSSEEELEASREALEKKAALYDHFAKGSEDYGANSMAFTDQYEVDFVSKGNLDRHPNAADDDETPLSKKDRQRELIHKFEVQTRQGRLRAAASKYERESFESKKRNRLKMEFLKRKLQKPNLAKDSSKT